MKRKRIKQEKKYFQSNIVQFSSPRVVLVVEESTSTASQFFRAFRLEKIGGYMLLTKVSRNSGDIDIDTIFIEADNLETLYSEGNVTIAIAKTIPYSGLSLEEGIGPIFITKDCYNDLGLREYDFRPYHMCRERREESGGEIVDVVGSKEYSGAFFILKELKDVFGIQLFLPARLRNKNHTEVVSIRCVLSKNPVNMTTITFSVSGITGFQIDIVMPETFTTRKKVIDYMVMKLLMPFRDWYNTFPEEVKAKFQIHPHTLENNLDCLEANILGDKDVNKYTTKFEDDLLGTLNESLQYLWRNHNP